MNTQELHNYLQIYTSMGFETSDIFEAFTSCAGRKSLFLDTILEKTKNKKKEVKNPMTQLQSMGGLAESQILFEKDILRAMQKSNEDDYPKPNELARKKDEPVGLKNIGNTCYFNCLLQTLFQIKEFKEEVLAFREPKDINKVLNGSTNPLDTKRKLKCLELINNLQIAIGFMIYGNKKIINPDNILKSIVDIRGNEIKIGEQLDIGEFSINFLERIEEGLSLSEHKTNSYANKSEGSQDQSTFSKLFFGKFKDFISFEWNKNNFKVNTKKNQDVVFGPINLDINHKELMSSFYAYMNLCIDGYKSPDNEITMAKKKSWIMNAPKILSFILQRVQYQKDVGLVKNNNAFDFDKEINIDRYLLENKKKLKDTNELLSQLKIQEKKIDDEIQNLKNNEKNNIDLRMILSSARLFIESQLEDTEKEFIEFDSVNDNIEESITCDELKRTMKTINKLEKILEKKIITLEEQKKMLKTQIQNSSINLNKSTYHLYSIIVHEGSAEFGHYFALIYDKKSNKWIKYNDSIITDITEHKAMTLSRGDNDRNCSAYCLFYMKNESNSIEENDDFMKLMPETLLNQIQLQNSKFNIEIEHYESNIIQKIYTSYIEAIKTLNFDTSEFILKLKGAGFPCLPILPSFNIFLNIDSKNCTEIAKWKILFDILRKFQIPYDILLGEKLNFYYEELKKMIVNDFFNYKLKTLELNEESQMLLQKKKLLYLFLIKCIAMTQHILEQIQQSKWKEAIIVSVLLQDQLREIEENILQPTIYFSNYLIIILSLKLCALIDQNLSKNNVKEGMQYLEMLIYALKKREVLKISKKIIEQIINNVNYTAGQFKNILGHEYNNFTFLIKCLKDQVEYSRNFDQNTFISKDFIKTINDYDNSDTWFYDTFNASKQIDQMCNAWNSIAKHLLKVKYKQNLED